jgi:hypothetical protein
MNPHSNVFQLFSQPIDDQDHTVILHIPLPNLVINDIFVDDHRHFWSISEELSLMTPDKNPLTNLPFEPGEWERIVKARNWGKKIEDPPSLPQVLPPLPPLPLPSYSPITEYTWDNCSWVCCPDHYSFSHGEETYDVECRFMCMYLRRNQGRFPGSCVWCIPLCSCHEIRKEDACYPLCCVLCMDYNSCLFKRNLRGYFFPCGCNYITNNQETECFSCCMINNCYRNNTKNLACVTLPLYCQCSSGQRECCATPLCIEVDECFVSPLACSRGPVYCLLGIPIMKMS